MNKRKPFSILKWLVFPSLTLALAATIAWFNLRTFGLEDGAIYVGVVAAITLFSIAINKYVKLADDDDPANDHLAVTAFVFEIVLTLALAVNAAYSLSVQREMSVARQMESKQGQNLESVSKFKSKAAQREATKMLHEQAGGSRNSQVIFAENERPLFWIMIGELLAYGVAAFTLLATASLRRSPRQVAQDTGLLSGNGPQSDFPEELDVGYRPESKNAALRQSRPKSEYFSTVATVADQESALKTLRAVLKSIAEYHKGWWFKADLIPGGILIRLTERQDGREVTIAKTRQSSKLLSAVNRPDFRERLVAELKECGFPIGGER